MDVDGDPPRPDIDQKRMLEEEEEEEDDLSIRPSKKIRVESAFGSSDNAAVAAHYHNRQDLSFRRRNVSPIYNLKELNNWIKSVLILTWTQRGDFVLDICGGKGGDLAKWAKADIEHLTLADVAYGSVQDAVARYNACVKKRDRGSYRFSAHWISVDCCLPILQQELSRVDFFDVVSCQFSIHYAFETSTRIDGFIQNVSYKLRPGGFFFCTTTDANRLLAWAKKSSDHKTFGNDFFKVEFDEPFTEIRSGLRYRFFLEDAVENVIEYVVDPNDLIDICNRYSLELVRRENLQDLYYEEIQNPEFEKLAVQRGIPLNRKEIDQNTWETAGLYISFIFKKKGDPETIRHKVTFPIEVIPPSRAVIDLSGKNSNNKDNGDTDNVDFT